ncbi:hypothetical protein R1sor_001325 [Riccia sorocarpa]|uniref:Reverse transcriptase domain-containing protein n=1 Tax=Riccia sorocarpa TaxID=122646 RepID=A0ABD3GWH5_9MARC
MIGGYARVIVNNRLTPDFLLACGVHQGCPLAPMLYVLITSALILQTERVVSDGRIKRLHLALPGVTVNVVNSFADDTAFAMQTDEASFAALAVLLQWFFLVSGCKVNWRKTKHLDFGKYLTILSFSLVLVYLRQKDIRSLERLFAVFLWDSNLVVWNLLVFPLEYGGAGIWSLGQAFLGPFSKGGR